MVESLLRPNVHDQQLIRGPIFSSISRTEKKIATLLT